MAAIFVANCVKDSGLTLMNSLEGDSKPPKASSTTSELRRSTTASRLAFLAVSNNVRGKCSGLP
jgi:hypothetical protein